MRISKDPRRTLSHKEHPMLTPPTRDTRPALTLLGRSQALLEQTPRPEIAAVRCEERLGLLVDRARTARANRRRTTRLHKAQRRQTAWIEAIDSRHPRGVGKSWRRRCATCPWRRDRHKVRSTGPSGLGTTCLACALGHQACRAGWTVLSRRLPRLLQECPLAQGDGRDGKRMTALAKTAGRMLDAWGLAPLRDDHRRDVLARLAERSDCRATIVTRHLPVEHWHEATGDPTLAEARLDRLVHNAYTIAFKGDSMRQRQAVVPTQVPARDGRPRPASRGSGTTNAARPGAGGWLIRGTPGCHRDDRS